MSDFSVQVVRIDSVIPHPNADRLDIVQVMGWYCVVQKGLFKEGDKCIYIPIDAVLPTDVEQILFGPDAKVKLSNHRVRTIKLRGQISQGMVVPLSDLGVHESSDVGTVLTETLGITKYEPPAPPSSYGLLPARTKRDVNHLFKEYTDISNWKNHPAVFEEGDVVVITEKLHGTNFRCGWLPRKPHGIWQQFQHWMGWFEEWEFCYGSRRVQLQRKTLYNGYYAENVYAKIVKQYRLDELLRTWRGTILYGEIVGDKIQKGYHYGCDAGEHKLVVFDFYLTSGPVETYMDFSAFEHTTKCLCLKHVPVLYVGEYNAAILPYFTTGDSVYAPTQKGREGVVIRPLRETTHPHIGRKILKRISDEYLLKEQSDQH